jgi:dipeptidase E
MPGMRLLLLSNSTNHGEGYLDHAIAAVRAFFGPRRRLAFVPFALHDQAAYTRQAQERLQREGFEVDGLTADSAGAALLEAAEGVCVGGGNTFRLLDTLQRSGLLEPLRRRVRAGLPYLGASAGTNLVAPTIRTTNDMPIVQPKSFEALGLLPFQINPHYLDADVGSPHMGETRETRLLEYLEDNETPVLGLREGAWLRLESGVLTLEGRRGARLFRRGAEPRELAPGADLSALLAPVVVA